LQYWTDQWGTLISSHSNMQHGTIRKQEDAKNLHLDVILDYSDRFSPGRQSFGDYIDRRHDLKKVEKQFGQTMNGTNIKAKSLLLQSRHNIYTGLKFIDGTFDFYRRAASKVTLGCSYRPYDGYESAIDLIDNCKKANGSFYVFKAIVELDSLSFRTNDYLYYENNVRDRLEIQKRFRHKIWQEHPEAKVILRVDVSKTRQAAVGGNKQLTAFCSSVVYEANLYYEAIVMWAKLNGFPLILKSAFDYLNRPEISGWFSYLRPKGVFKVDEGKNYSETLGVTALNPFFVLRNYPEGINNWTVDPCIEWSQTPPEIGGEYFHSQNIGAIFHTENVYQEKAYEIMLQFVTHRFYVTEVVVGKNAVDVTSAMETLSSNGLLKSDTQFFISFNINDFENKLWSAPCLQLLRELATADIPNIKGIHLDLQNNTIAEMLDKNVKEIIVEGRKSQAKIDTGVLISSSNCFEIAKLLVNPQNGSKELERMLSQLNYIVCKDELELISQDDPQNLGNQFDTNLYLKKFFTQFQPHLNIHFRVEMVLPLNEDSESLERYMRAISHFKSFSIAYDIRYFLVEAFDETEAESGYESGWWTFNNKSDLTDPHSYVERESGKIKNNFPFLRLL